MRKSCCYSHLTEGKWRPERLRDMPKASWLLSGGEARPSGFGVLSWPPSYSAALLRMGTVNIYLTWSFCTIFPNSSHCNSFCSWKGVSEITLSGLWLTDEDPETQGGWEPALSPGPCSQHSSFSADHTVCPCHFSSKEAGWRPVLVRRPLLCQHSSRLAEKIGSTVASSQRLVFLDHGRQGFCEPSKWNKLSPC